MTAKILMFDGITRLDLPAERVLNKALESNLTDVVVIGFDEDGGEFFISNKADGAEVLWMLERAKHRLMTITDGIEAGEVEF